MNKKFVVVGLFIVLVISVIAFTASSKPVSLSNEIGLFRQQVTCPRPIIVSPKPLGDVGQGIMMVTAYNHESCADETQLDDIENFKFEYSEDKINFISIGDQDDEVFQEWGGSKSVLWDTSSLETGRAYWLKVTMWDTSGRRGVGKSDFTLIQSVGNNNTGTFCGCQSMTIRTNGQSGNYPTGPGGSNNNYSLGGQSTVNLGNAGPYRFAMAFEVSAPLVAGSNPALCGEGQLVKRTRLLGISSSNTTIGGVDCGIMSSNWCNDDYTNPATNGFKVHDGNTIRWFDSPGRNRVDINGNLVGTLSRAGLMAAVPHGFSWDAAFQSFVTGTAGQQSCQCNYTVTSHVLPNGTVATAPNVGNVNCVTF